MRIPAILAALLVVAPIAVGHEHADADLAVLHELEPIFEIEAGARVTDRPWVVLDVAGPDRKFVVRGWMLEDMAGFVRILAATGKSRTLRRPAFFERRGAPRGRQPGDRHLGSTFGDFAKECRDLLAAKRREHLIGNSDTLEAAVSQARL
jgi:hypothetical protein